MNSTRTTPHADSDRTGRPLHSGEYERAGPPRRARHGSALWIARALVAVGLATGAGSCMHQDAPPRRIMGPPVSQPECRSFATYDMITVEAFEGLLETFRASVGDAGDDSRVAVVDIRCSDGSDLLRDHRPGLLDLTWEVAVNAGACRVVGRDAITSGQRAAKLVRASDLMNADTRAAFVAAVGDVVDPPDYLAWGTMTIEDGARTAQQTERRYALTFEMIDATTGDLVATHHVELVKEYVR